MLWRNHGSKVQGNQIPMSVFLSFPLVSFLLPVSPLPLSTAPHSSFLTQAKNLKLSSGYGQTDGACLLNPFWCMGHLRRYIRWSTSAVFDTARIVCCRVCVMVRRPSIHPSIPAISCCCSMRRVCCGVSGGQKQHGATAAKASSITFPAAIER